MNDNSSAEARGRSSNEKDSHMCQVTLTLGKYRSKNKSFWMKGRRVEARGRDTYDKYLNTYKISL